MTPIQRSRLQLLQALAHAEEQLAISDAPADKARWGIRCDQIEAGLADLQEEA